MTVKITFQHYRVIKSGYITEYPKKGKPQNLLQYSRKNSKLFLKGFVFSISPYSRGGKTICYICDRYKREDGKEVDDILATGEALCSMSDNFCYRIGRQTAFLRALLKVPDEFLMDVLAAHYKDPEIVEIQKTNIIRERQLQNANQN